MRTALLVITLFLTVQLPAQRRVGFAYYDVDGLYDTQPSPFYDDSDYTPQGRLHWDNERYELRTAKVAAVIDSMSMPVVALFGVENEQVVRDIVSKCRGDYCYIHRTLNRLDGLDFALLYYGDVLFPKRVNTGYDYMTVEAAIGDREYAIVLTRCSRFTGDVVAELQAEQPDRFIIVAGDLYRIDYRRFGLDEATARAERAGRGNAMFRRGWTMADRILVDRRLDTRCDVYARRWLLDSRGAPSAVYNRNSYTGGYGRRLPIFCYICEKTCF